MAERTRGLRKLVLGTAGPARDRLNALVLAGRKVATAGLHDPQQLAQEQQLERVGECLVLLDSADEPIGIVEVTRVEVWPFLDVPWEFAAAEGEDYQTIEQWRQDHREWFAAEGMLMPDDAKMVCLWFHLLAEPPPVQS